MAWTEFASGDPQTVKLWGKFTFYDVMKQTFLERFMGTDELAIIQRITDLESEAGDTVKFDLLYKMTGFGVDGDSPLKGYEEAMRYAQDKVGIDQKRLGHRFSRMSQQRTVHNLRQDGRKNLSMRWSTIIDLFLAAYLCGTAGDNTALAAALPFAGNSLQAPDAQHLYAPASAFTTDFIDICVERADTFENLGLPNMRKANFEGEEKYVMLLHPYAISSLRRTTSANLWREIVAMSGQRGSANPLYSGALGEWNGVVLHKWERLPYTSTGVYSLFLGAQAGVIAFGNAYDKLDQERVGKENMMSWWEDNGEDYGNKKGVACGAILGMKKCQFTDPDDATATARDFGVIRCFSTDTAS